MESRLQRKENDREYKNFPMTAEADYEKKNRPLIIK